MAERLREEVGASPAVTSAGVLDVPHSVFGKLVVVMTAMTVSLLFLVGGFFWFVGGPNGDGTIRRMLEGQSRNLAATSPDLATATQLGNRLGVQTRYEGPAGSWSTSSDLPAIDEARGRPLRHLRFLQGRDYYVVAAPDGGSYLFSWDISQTMQGAHLRLLILLLAIIAGVVLIAHTILNRQLRPLRELSAGVARLTAGELNVVLPARTRDEFGKLTLAFNKMVDRIRQMIAARDQLLLAVSHELRSPLTRLTVALELLPPSEQRTRMAADLSEMETMIAELLELERLRSGGRLMTVRANVTPLLRDVADRFHGRPPGIRVIAPREPVPLDLDVERIRTALRNLLENALKYSLPDSRPVELSARRENGRLVIRVTDDGPGIPDRDKASVFEPFFRVDSSRSRKTGGYGLGLSIAKRIVEAHGGTVEAENNPGRGASFIVRLPAP